jgi:hypothetical protein
MDAAKKNTSRSIFFKIYYTRQTKHRKKWDKKGKSNPIASLDRL